MDEENILETQGLIDENDLLILLHREAHFGGSFPLMAAYYAKDGKGVQPEIDPKRIQELFEIEQAANQNLAAFFFTGKEAEKIKEVREHYEQLRALYETDKPSKEKLIADLILSESDHPEEEIQAIADKGSEMLIPLIRLLQSETYHDPLFPGYGLAPSHALKCISLIGNEKAIHPLFEAIGNEGVEGEEEALIALKRIGEPAFNFLMKVAKSKPFTTDNERAAIALIAFKDREDAGKAALDLLKIPELRQKTPYSSYLALVCEGIKNEEDRKEFIKLAEDPLSPKILKDDIQMISKLWKKK